MLKLQTNAQDVNFVKYTQYGYKIKSSVLKLWNSAQDFKIIK